MCSCFIVYLFLSLSSNTPGTKGDVNSNTGRVKMGEAKAKSKLIDGKDAANLPDPSDPDDASSSVSDERNV